MYMWNRFKNVKDLCCPWELIQSCEIYILAMKYQFWLIWGKVASILGNIKVRSCPSEQNTLYLDLLCSILSSCTQCEQTKRILKPLQLLTHPTTWPYGWGHTSWTNKFTAPCCIRNFWIMTGEMITFTAATTHHHWFLGSGIHLYISTPDKITIFSQPSFPVVKL
jgi:hypothetical protein